MFVFKNHILQPLFNNLDVFQRPKDWQLVFSDSQDFHPGIEETQHKFRLNITNVRHVKYLRTPLAHEKNWKLSIGRFYGDYGDLGLSGLE
jgi:hypothetical protein